MLMACSQDFFLMETPHGDASRVIGIPTEDRQLLNMPLSAFCYWFRCDVFALELLQGRQNR